MADERDVAPSPDDDRRGPGRALTRLADQLLELEEGQEATRRTLRRLRSRVETANGHRHRLLALTAALLRRRHGESLAALGAEPYDLAEAAVEASYEGLLIALVRDGRSAGAEIRRILLVGAPESHPLPGFAAELLALPIERFHAPGQPLPAELAQGAAGVVSARDLRDGRSDLQALRERAPLLLVLTEPQDGEPPAGDDGEAPRDLALALIERLAEDGLEPVHVTGDGRQIAFARKGLLAPGRADGFSAGQP